MLSMMLENLTRRNLLPDEALDLVAKIRVSSIRVPAFPARAS